jgi:glycosyltransferase involved in cell wall biosynthesis
VLALVPGARDRIAVTYNAVSPAFSPPTDPETSRRRAAAVLGTEAPYFLVVGKNEPYKAHHIAVQAFAAAAQPSERLVLVQREHPGRGLSRLVRRLGLPSRVIWAPSLSQDDLIEVLRSARALLQPSVIEGFGIPVLEAIACGCPVVASDTPALVEVLDGAALHGRIGDPDDIARAIRRLRDQALQAELRERGLERARAFSWDATARATLDVYRDAHRAGPLLR